MNLNMLTFRMPTHEKFIIHIWDLDDIIHCCYQTVIILYVDRNKLIIANSDVQEYAEQLERTLILTLHNKLQLHESIKTNIGYCWNQDMNENNSDLYYEKEENLLEWIGTKYLLWSTSSQAGTQQFATWLYNDDQGNIIFQVTPVYPETFIDIENSDEVHAYQSWMEHYQPFYTRIISQETAKQWLKQARLILKTIRTNVKKVKKELI